MRIGDQWRILTAVWCVLAAGCAAPEPRTAGFTVTDKLIQEAFPDLGKASGPSGAPDTACRSLECLAERAKNSVIAIDERGRYTPVIYHLPDGSEVTQPMSGFECDPDPASPPSAQYSQCFKRHADNIIGQLLAPPQDARNAGARYHLLIFVHGGLNEEKGRLTRAFVDANRIFDDRNVADLRGPLAGRIQTGEEVWYPLFVTWPSGGPQSYLDQRIHYNQGDYNSPFKRVSSPLYFLTDAVEAIVRAPVAWAESFSWVELGENPSVTYVGDQIGCQSRELGYHCAPADRDERPMADELWYWSPVPGLLGRAITVPAVDVVGQPAWDAMVSRTSMLMRKPFNVEEFAAAYGQPGREDDPAQAALDPKTAATGEPLDSKADLWHLLDKLAALEEERRPPITLIGHSMGAIVVNKILQSFPALPYRNIVFMGSAASVRDTLVALDAVATAGPHEDLRAFNLSLHQDAEANEVGYFGSVSKGSLLEWVDRMYTTPATFGDRTIGKWINVVMARDDVAHSKLRSQIYFKRFGLSCAEPLKHTEFDEYDERCGQVRTPYWRPSFWIVSEPDR